MDSLLVLEIAIHLLNLDSTL